MPTRKQTRLEKDADKISKFSMTLDILGKPVKIVCDPIVKVCYPVLEKHWQERYRKYWPDRFARRMLILDFTLLTIVAFLIVMAGATYFIAPVFTVVPNVHVDILTPSEVVSGKTESFSVSYVNDSSATLGCASLRVHLPENTTVVTPIPPRVDTENFCNADGTARATVVQEPSETVLVYDIGNMEPNARGLVTFDATVFAPTGSHPVMASELLYWREAATEASRASSRKEWAVSDALLRLAVTPPTSLVRGKTAAVTYSYENASGATLPPVTLRLEHPSDFVLTGSTLPGLSYEWTLGSLAAGAKGQFTLYGYFADSPDAKSAPVLTLGAYIKDGAQERLLESVRQNLDPKASGLVMTQDLSGAEGRGGLVPGEKVTARVHYANNGTEALHDVTVSLYADGRFVENPWPSELTWDKGTVSELASVEPGQSGTLEATFVVRTDPPAGEDGAAPLLKTSAIASFSLASDPESTIRASTAMNEIPITTRLGVEASALYYTKDGDQLGIGPLPPRVGQTTTYRVVLQLTNTSGAVNGAVLEAVLPPGVEWTDKASVSNGQGIDWLPSSRKIRWDIGDMPAYAGSVGEYVGASFEVALTPAPDEAGASPVLLQDIQLDGKDKQTGLSLHATAEPVTTELPFDQRAAGKGTVEAK